MLRKEGVSRSGFANVKRDLFSFLDATPHEETAFFGCQFNAGQQTCQVFET